MDNFAGGGGASTGIEIATGRLVALAVNHDPAAILMHRTNHPYTEHFQASVWDIDPKALVETLTDNRNRTAADLRHYFDKNGGNLGAMGCVAFLFSQKGVIDISLEDKDADEAMMDALDAGAEDFDASEDAAEITTDPENYSAVVKALEEKGYEILSDDLAMVPMTTTRLEVV